MLTGERIIAARQTVEARCPEAGLGVIITSDAHVDIRGGVLLTVVLYVQPADVEATHAAMQEAARATPSCTTCGDTHTMTLGDRDVMCTHCPVPCDHCRDWPGAYCTTTPCPCRCHVLEARDAAARGEDQP